MKDAFEIGTQMRELLAAMRENKPQDRSETARAWAVSITEMEKAYAYFYAYVLAIKPEPRLGYPSGE